MFKKIGIFFLIAIVISAITLYFNEVSFSKETWHNSPTERHKMVNNLLESRNLLGMSKDSIIALLGPQDKTYYGETEHLAYTLGDPPSFFKNKPNGLLIIFKDNIVTKVTLYESDLPNP